jgi:hypothetical protein
MKLLSLPTTRDYRLAICTEKHELAISVNQEILFWNWLEDRCRSPEWELDTPWRIRVLQYSSNGSALAIGYEKVPHDKVLDATITYLEVRLLPNGKVTHRFSSTVGFEDFTFPSETYPSRFIEADSLPKTGYHIWDIVDGKAQIDWVLPKKKDYRESRFYDQGVLQVADEAIYRYPCFSEMNHRTPIGFELSTEKEQQLAKGKRRSKSSKKTPSRESNFLLTTPSTFSFERGMKEKAIAVHPDGSQILLGGVSGRVRLYSIDQERELACWDWPIGYVESIAFSSDGLIAAAVGLRSQVVVWDLEG